MADLPRPNPDIRPLSISLLQRLTSRDLENLAANDQVYLIHRRGEPLAFIVPRHLYEEAGDRISAIDSLENRIERDLKKLDSEPGPESGSEPETELSGEEIPADEEFQSEADRRPPPKEFTED